MSSETDIEKLARSIVTNCELMGLRMYTRDSEQVARAYLAEKQRADDLAKRERELRELVRQFTDEHHRDPDRISLEDDDHCSCNLCKQADALLAKEPQ